MDFSRIHRGVAHFGIGLEDVADDRGLCDALGILQAAIDETEDRDLRQDRGTLDALTFIRERMGGRLAAASDFEKALTIPHAAERRGAVEAAFYRLRNVIWGATDLES